MGLFGKKKDYTELALEEARRADAADAADAKGVSASVTPAVGGGSSVKKIGFSTSFTAPKDAGPVIEELMRKIAEANPTDLKTVTAGETVTVTSTKHWGSGGANLDEALAALGFGPGALPQLPGVGPQEPDGGFSAALDTIERDYKGRPAAEAKVAIEAALKEHHHTIPDGVVDMIAKSVSEGAAIDITFGGANQTPPGS